MESNENNTVARSPSHFAHIRVLIGIFIFITVLGVLGGTIGAVETSLTVVSKSEKTFPQKITDLDQSRIKFSRIARATTDILAKNDSYKKVKLQKEKTALSTSLRAHVILRKSLLKELAKSDPRLFLSSALKKQTRASLPSALQKEVETESVIDGVLNVVHVDDPSPVKSHFEYTLTSPSKKYALFSTRPISLRSGTKVHVKGVVIDDQIVVNNEKTITAADSSLQVLQAAPLPESVGSQKTLVLLLKSSTVTPEPFPSSQGRDLIFGSQFERFMEEQSYGQVSFTGDVYGWSVVPNATQPCSAFDENQLGQIVTSNSVDLSRYRRVLYVVASSQGGGCSDIGMTNRLINGRVYRFSWASVGVVQNQLIDYGVVPFPWTNLDYQLSHELGHSLGLQHANSWNCDTDTINGDACQHIEYGNHFDAMGYGTMSLHFNAASKELLGWITPSRTRLISAQGTTTVTLNPLETGTGINLAKISILGTALTPYYLEYRQPIGFDANLAKPDLVLNTRGVVANYIAKNAGQAPRLIDLMPTTDEWLRDIQHQASLDQDVTNTTYKDTGRGITIGPVRSSTASAVTFDVNLATPPCVRKIPTVTPISSMSIVPGATGFISVAYTNNDYFGCSASEFRVTTTVPAGWSLLSEYPTGTQIISSGDDGWKNINFMAPENAPTGVYSVRLEVTNLPSGMTKSVAFTVTVGDPLTISSITPLSGFQGSLVTLTGSGFAQPTIQGVSNNSITFFNLATGGNTQISTSSFDGRTLSFKIPSTITDCSFSTANGCVVATPPGIYRIQVFVVGGNGGSNTINFEVKSTRPEITAYPTTQGEQYVTGEEMTVMWTTKNISATTSLDIYLARSATGDPSGVSAQSVRVLNTGSTVWRLGSPTLVPIGTYYTRVKCSFDLTCIEGVSAPFSVIAPPLSVKIVGTPTLAIVHDALEDTELLVARFTVEIFAGPAATHVNKEFTLYARTALQNSEIYPDTSTVTLLSGNAVDEGDTYLIAANTTATFTVTGYFTPEAMPGGEYYATLAGVSADESYVGASLNQTNKVTVTGASTPFIMSIIPDTVDVNHEVTISGVRFSKSNNIVTVGEHTFEKASADGKTIRFVPRSEGILPGEQRIIVTDPEMGESNEKYIDIQTTELVSIENVSFSAKTVSVGDTLTISIQAKNNTDHMLSNVHVSAMDERAWGAQTTVNLAQQSDIEGESEVNEPITFTLYVRDIHATYNPHHFSIKVDGVEHTLEKVEVETANP